MSSVATSVVTAEQFLNYCEQSGLFSAAQLREVRFRCQSAPVGQITAGKLATLLVHSGWLTRFQARLILAGKTRDLIIAGKYKLLDLLGKGGMGQVYLCEHARLRRKVALKMLPNEQARDAATLERFNREAQALAALKHSNIVNAYDADTDGHRHFLVMEYVDGPGLDQIIQERGALPVDEACHFIYQAACGLQHAFEEGWVHRDIKPSNLLLDPNGVVKILDLGLARLSENSHSVTQQFNEQTAVFGTADYIAPEQAINSTDVDIRADIYSLGATLYHALAGQPPFPQGNAAQKLLWHQLAEPQSLAELRPKLPARLITVVEKMMAKKPVDRLQMPYEVALSLAPFVGIAAEAVPPPREPQRVRSTGQSQRWRSTPSGNLTTPPPSMTTRPTASSTTLGHSATGRLKAPSGRVVRARGSPRRWRLWAMGVPAGIGLITLLTVGYTMLFSKSDPKAGAANAGLANGEVVVSMPNGFAHVTMDLLLRDKQAGRTSKYAATQDRRLQVPIGQYQVTVTGLPDGLMLVNSELNVRRGGQAYLRFIRIPSGQEIRESQCFRGHVDIVQCLAFAPDSRRFASGSGGQGTRDQAESGTENVVRLWQVGRAESAAEARNFSTVTSLQYSPDGQRLLVSSKDGLLREFDVETASEKQRYVLADRATTPVSSVAYLREGKHLVSAGGDGNTLSMWERGETADRRWRFRGHTGRVEAVVERPGVPELLSVGVDGTLRAWNAQTREPLLDFPRQHTGAIWGLDVTADGKFAATAGDDATVRIWDLDARAELQVLRGHEQRVNSVRFSPDGKWLLTASDDSTARLWDRESGKERHFLKGHSSEVTQAVFSPDGRYLLTSGYDKTIRLWEMPKRAD